MVLPTGDAWNERLASSSSRAPLPLPFFFFFDDDDPPPPPDVEAEAVAETEAVEAVMLELAAEAYEGDSTSSMDDSESDGL